MLCNVHFWLQPVTSLAHNFTSRLMPCQTSFVPRVQISNEDKWTAAFYIMRLITTLTAFRIISSQERTVWCYVTLWLFASSLHPQLYCLQAYYCIVILERSLQHYGNNTPLQVSPEITQRSLVHRTKSQQSLCTSSPPQIAAWWTLAIVRNFSSIIILQSFSQQQRNLPSV